MFRLPTSQGTQPICDDCESNEDSASAGSQTVSLRGSVARSCKAAHHHVVWPGRGRALLRTVGGGGRGRGCE